MIFLEFAPECPAGAYQKAIHVTEAQTDAFGRMSPGAIARYICGAAVEHMSAVGVHGSILRSRGLLLVLAQTVIWVERLPRQGENVLLRTWAGREKHWMYPRRSVIFSAEEETLVSTCSQWLLVDLNTRRLAPPSELMLAVPAISLPNEPKAPAMRMPFPVKLTAQTERVVQPQEIDMNGHLNNSYYLDWAMELLDLAYLQKHAMRFLWVEYCKELFVEQRATLQYQQEEDTLFLKGQIEGEDSFSVKMDFGWEISE